MRKVVLDVRNAVLLLMVIAAGSLIATQIFARGDTPQAAAHEPGPPQQPTSQQPMASQPAPQEPAQPQEPLPSQESAQSAAQAAQAAQSMAHHHHGDAAAHPHIQVTAPRPPAPA